MRKVSMVLAVAAAVLIAQPVWAEEGAGAGQGRFAGRGGGHHGGEMLRMMDKNGDGSVSREEFSAGASERFAKMDKNGDGVLNKDDRPERPAGAEGEGRRRFGGGRGGPGEAGGGDGAPAPDVTTDAPPAE